MLNLIDNYTNKILIPLLQEYQVARPALIKVAGDIKNRLSSILIRWNDEDYRSTILFHGIEEATFYKPTVKDIQIGAFVVVCVRNSLLEDIASTVIAANTLGLPGPVLSDNQIKTITSLAISYFVGFDLSMEASKITEPSHDPFFNIPTLYPLAWNAMKRLSKCKRYEKFYKIKLANSPTLLISAKENLEFCTVVLSGMDPNIGSSLNQILDHIKEGNAAFFSDSFKMITRHPDKLYKVIETVLSYDSPVVTFNYYLNNGYVARRTELLKPAHSDKDVNQKFNNTHGLRKVHLDILKTIR